MFFVIITIVCFFWGCDSNIVKYQENDIEKYVKDGLHLNDFTVSSNYESVCDSDGCSNKMWTVVDNENNVTFHVNDDYYQSSQEFVGMVNNLRNDYKGSLFLKYYENSTKKDNIIIERNKDVDDKYNDIIITCNAQNKKELDNCYNSLVYYNNLVSVGLYYRIYYKYQINDSIQIKERITEIMGDINDKYDDIIFNFYYLGVSYQDHNIIDFMNDEDYVNLLNNNSVYKIVKINSDGSKKTYDKFVSAKNYQDISFAILYIILKEEDMIISGDEYHYVVKGINDNVIEVSYEFNDGTYYIKINDKIKRVVSPNVGSYDLKNIIGLNIEFEK